MSEFSRRDLLRHIGTSLTLGAAGEYVLAAQDVQHVHQALAPQNGHYTPKSLTAHEYATLQRLSDLIIPADEHSPGALSAGAADFIDFLCSASDEMKLIYTGGLAWLDEAMKHRYAGRTFLAADPSQQTAMLDLIAYRENLRQDPSLGAGNRLFHLGAQDGGRRLLHQPHRHQRLGLHGQYRHDSFQRSPGSHRLRRQTQSLRVRQASWPVAFSANQNLFYLVIPIPSVPYSPQALRSCRSYSCLATLASPKIIK